MQPFHIEMGHNDIKIQTFNYEKENSLFNNINFIFD